MKVVINGPVYSGKTTLGTLLSEKYQIAHITIAKLIDEVSNM